MLVRNSDAQLHPPPPPSLHMNLSRGVAPLALALSLSACATIVGGGSRQNVTINTGAQTSFVVKSSSGIQMAQGSGGQTISLPRRHEYQVDVTAPGYSTQTVALSKSLNGWFWGNFIIGWIPGFIVDFATGAAYKLEPSTVTVVTQKATTGDALEGFVRFLNRDGGVVAEKPIRLERVGAVAP